MNWIKCSDRLPEKTGEYLVWNGTCIFLDDFHLQENYWKYGANSIIANSYVTHWMPLPEPPKEEE